MDTWLASSQPNTDHYILTFCMSQKPLNEKKKKKTKKDTVNQEEQMLGQLTFKMISFNFLL